MRKIQVLSIACPECVLARESAGNAVGEIGAGVEAELILDPAAIRDFGIYVTPAPALH